MADVASWINSILEKRNDLPFTHAKVEKSAAGKRTRKDLTLFDRDGNKALTGEVKMPDAPDGQTPYDDAVVQDAFQKASDVGAPYFFTWNVNRFVLWDPSKVRLPVLQRQSRDYRLFKLRLSEEVESQEVVHKLRNEFLPKFLEEFAAIFRGETLFGVLPPDQRFILMLEDFLDRPLELTRNEISNRWRSTAHFRSSLTNWMVKEQKWTIPRNDADLAELLDRAAKLCCYVLATKLIFYEALRRKFKSLKPINVSDSVDSADRLEGLLTHHFKNAQAATNDYETIFWPDYGAKIPLLAPGAVDSWKRVIDQIALFDLRNMGYDVLGPIFQRLIDKDAKHKFGQHYTNPNIVDVINAFTIRSANDVVLDPGCGSGTFLVRAYARKRWMNKDAEHAKLLRELYGVDWSGFAVHLSALGLATQDLVEADNYPCVGRSDFFDVAPDRPFITLPLGKKEIKVAIPHIDAAVGNPPYIRQEEILKTRKKAYQNLTAQEAPTFDFSGRSDIYVYFWPHLASFLQPDGRIGLLTSSSWLDVEYGFRLQKWLLENFKILAILESTEPWFQAARVQTAVTIVQLCKDQTERTANRVRFVQLRAPVADLLQNDGTEDGRQRAAESLRDLILSTNKDTTSDRMRSILRTQKELWDEGCQLAHTSIGANEEPEEGEPKHKQKTLEALATGRAYVGGKWGRYLRAPDFFFEITQKYGNSFVPLAELADVRFGVKSGCDDFFFPTDYTSEALSKLKSPARFKDHYGVSRTTVESGKIKIVKAGDGSVWPIEAQYLEPELHSTMDVHAVIVKPETINRQILLVNKQKKNLNNTLVLEYLKYGEKETFGGDQPVAERSSCAARPLWYDITGGLRGDVFWPMIQKYRHVVAVNPEYGEEGNKRKLICNHNLFDIAATNRKHASALAAVLNSTIVAFSKHFYGRYAEMEGTLKTEVVDVKMLPVPDTRLASDSQLKTLEGALERMGEREIDYFLEEEFLEMVPLKDLDKLAAVPPRKLPPELRYSDRQDLDRAVFSLIGVPDREIPLLLERLYLETALVYRRGRILDIRTAANKRTAKKGGSATPHEIAESVMESLPSGILKLYPADFLVDSEGVDHYSLPDGLAKLIEDMFHHPRLKFRSDEIEFRHRPQAELALALHQSGLTGTLGLPTDPERCYRVKEQWNTYLQGLASRLQEEVSQRTPDEEKANAAHKLLLRWAVEG